MNTYAPLALLTGRPAFAEPLHVGRPNLGNRQRLLGRIGAILDRNWLTNDGPLVRELEQRLADTIGVAHCVAMCNATIALEIAIRAAALHGEVIVPSYTFIATAHALQWQEITPVFCDVRPGTHHIDPARIEALITPRTTGIIGVHLWGQPCPIDELTAVAGQFDLTLLFDAAHAFGCSYGGRMIGGFGLAEIFSFHATKFLNAFEGGAVATNDEAFAGKIRLMRNFGFAGHDHVIHVGTNGKMTEVAAAMGLTNLESLEEFIAVNHRHYLQYRRELAGIPGVRLVTYDESNRCNYQYIVADIDDETAPLTRDELLAVLHAENILARRYFFPGCHRMQPYRAYFPHARLLLPETERVARRVLVLPTGTAIASEDVSTVCQVIRAAMAHGPLVRHQLEVARGARAHAVQHA